MPAPFLATDPAFADLLDSSFTRLVGRPLIPTHGTEAEPAHWLYERAPFCVLAHNTADDPIFIYGNKAVQRCFEYDWEELTRLPSRLSAELPNREERQRLLDIVRRQGFIGDYTGIRIAKSGRRFVIENAIVWELFDDAGTRHGQAAMFASWHDISE
ncbi:MEKHLA domain-containing protein [Labrys miyagiensis]|nr:MEKHLA domain-containing protein [Labrys miyagiensis]